MKKIILVGTGEMGGVFARGFLKSGFTVVPVNRNDNLDKALAIAATAGIYLPTLSKLNS